MTNEQIITQLLNGYHLSNKELEEAKKLIDSLQSELIKRIENK